MAPVDRLTAVSVAAASAINTELTIILSGVSEALRATPVGHPARGHLLEVQKSVARLAYDNSALLDYARAYGGKPTAVSMVRIAEIL